MFMQRNKNDKMVKSEVLQLKNNYSHADDFIKLGLNISYYRKLNGLTQMQLAEAINISRTHLSNIEAPNMSTSISLDTLFEIARVLDIPAFKLLIFKD